MHCTTTMGAFLNIFDRSGRVLCVRQSYGNHMWTTPGGRIEQDENPLEAALRETVEEVGILIPTATFNAVFWKSYTNDVVFSFSTVFTSYPFVFVPNSEISEAAFFSPNELPTPMAFNTQIRISTAATPELYAKRLFIFSEPNKYVAF